MSISSGYNLKLDRCVAQPGSALAWGARGRRFESFHTDQMNIRVSRYLSANPFFLVHCKNTTSRQQLLKIGGLLPSLRIGKASIFSRYRTFERHLVVGIDGAITVGDGLQLHPLTRIGAFPY